MTTRVFDFTLKSLKIKNTQVDALRIKNKLVFMHPTPFTVRNTEELDFALDHVGLNGTINILAGTYELTKTHALPNCTINGAGADNTLIKTKGYGLQFSIAGNSTINVKNLKLDSEDIRVNHEWAGVGIGCNTGDNLLVENCTFSNFGNANWNSPNIRITRTDSNKSYTIKNCTFDGRNDVVNYGHTNASIGVWHVADAYNVTIQGCTFNHTSQNTATPLRNAKAIAFLNNYGNTTLHNCIAYCNTYSANDSNYGISESTATSITVSATVTRSSSSRASVSVTVSTDNSSIIPEGTIYVKYPYSTSSTQTKQFTLSNGTVSTGNLSLCRSSNTNSFTISYMGACPNKNCLNLTIPNITSSSGTASDSKTCTI